MLALTRTGLPLALLAACVAGCSGEPKAEVSTTATAGEVQTALEEQKKVDEDERAQQKMALDAMKKK